MKYIRAESFRKALRYQKRYLSLRLNTLEENTIEEQPLTPTTKPKNRFKVVALSIVAMNRMKYLVRKYQRYLQKSSPTYNYKEKRRGGSSTNYSSVFPTAPLISTVLQPPSTMIRMPAEPTIDSSPTTTSSDLLSPAYNKDLYEIKPTTKQRREGKSRQQQEKEGPTTRDTNNTVAEPDANKTKPMLLQDLASSPEMENLHHHLPHTSPQRRSNSPVKPSSIVNAYEEMSPPVKESSSPTNNNRQRPQRPSSIHNITSGRREPIDEQQQTRSFVAGETSNLPEGFGRNDRPYISPSNRSFNSLRRGVPGTTGAVSRDNINIIDKNNKDDYGCQNQRLLSPPPKSYPRPKSDVLKTDFEPTRLDNSNRPSAMTSTSQQSHRNPTATHLGRSSNSQDDLKDYMKKLEDLQKRLKSQQMESHHRRSTKSSPRSIIAVDGGGVDDGEF